MDMVLSQVSKWFVWSVRYFIFLVVCFLLIANKGFSTDEVELRSSLQLFQQRLDMNSDISESREDSLNDLNLIIRTRRISSSNKISKAVNSVLIPELLQVKKWLKYAMEMKQNVMELSHIAADEQVALNDLVINCEQRIVDLATILSQFDSSTNHQLYMPIFGQEIDVKSISSEEHIVPRDTTTSSSLRIYLKEKDDMWIGIMCNFTAIQFNNAIDEDTARNQYCYSIQMTLRDTLPILHQQIEAIQREALMFYSLRSICKNENIETDKVAQNMRKSFIGSLNNLDSSQKLVIDFIAKMTTNIFTINTSRDRLLNQEEIVKETDRHYALIPTQSIFYRVFKFIQSFIFPDL